MSKCAESSLRIALISEHASPLSTLGSVDSGGQNVYVAQVARNLARQGHQVDVFTRRDGDTLPETLDWNDGVRVIQVPAGPPEPVRKEDLLPFMPAFTEFMARFLRWRRPAYDIVHANFWMSGLVAAELKHRLELPFVITFHALGRVRRIFQGEADGFSDQRFEIEDRIVQEADGIIAECPQDQLDLLGLYRADPAKISIIPCGFDPSELKPVSKSFARLFLDLDPAAPILLQLGRVVPRKGIDTAIRALAWLKRLHGIPAQLLVVGGDSEKPEIHAGTEIARLARIARDEGVAERVVFVGRRGREVLRYYFSAADIFITTPWYEPFGITPVEAMACGTPVIGSAVGGIKSTVKHGETGFLVDPHDNARAVADRAAELLSSPGMLERFGALAIERANALFTWQQVSDQIARYYQRVLRAPYARPRLPASAGRGLALPWAGGE